MIGTGLLIFKDGKILKHMVLKQLLSGATHGAVVKVNAQGDVIVGGTNPSPGDVNNTFYKQPNVVLAYKVNGMGDIPAADLQKAAHPLVPGG